MYKLLLLIGIGLLVFGCTQPATPANPSGLELPGMELGESVPLPSGTMTVQRGDTVEVDYVGTLEDGTVFDTSVQEEAERAGLRLRPAYEPLQFTVGEGQLIDGFEEGVLGMGVGEERNLTMPPEKAYGPVQEELMLYANRTELAPEFQNATLGGVVETSSGMRGFIVDSDNESITVDFNHPLAGKTLHFQVWVRKIDRPTE